MQLKLEGIIQLPKTLDEIIASIPPFDKDKHKNTTAPALSYISAFINKVDPILICTFYGLYKSRELPPTDYTSKELSEKRDFNVKIGEAAELLSHLLFCLWVKQKGYPDTCEDSVEYRKELYAFITNLLDEHYYRSTIIPFYVAKSGEEEGSTSSFLHRLTSSPNVKIELVDHSPEYLSLEFGNAQNEFIEEVVKPIVNYQPNSINSTLEEYLLKDEGQCLEFKSTLRYDLKAHENGVEKTNPKLEQEVLREVCAFLNSDGGVLIIGVSDDKKVLGLSDDYQTLPHKKDRDGFQVFLRDKLTQNLEPDLPGTVDVYFVSQNNKEVCIVKVEKAGKLVFLKEDANGRIIREPWIREGNHKRPLLGPAIAEYIKSHWPEAS